MDHRKTGETPVMEVLRLLEQEYPEAGPRLKFSNPYQALVALMLSAQTNDNQVNQVTPVFFARYPDIRSLAGAEVSEVAQLIRPVGLNQSKAAHLVASARLLRDQYGARVPDTFEELLRLPGVGRKTANVLLAVAFGKPGLGVDTHVHRVANRIGLAGSQSPEGTEHQLKGSIPEHLWGKAHHLLIIHGREVCRARRPDCSACRLRQLCRSYQAGPEEA